MRDSIRARIHAELRRQIDALTAEFDAVRDCGSTLRVGPEPEGCRACIACLKSGSAMWQKALGEEIQRDAGHIKQRDVAIEQLDEAIKERDTARAALARAMRALDRVRHHASDCQAPDGQCPKYLAMRDPEGAAAYAEQKLLRDALSDLVDLCNADESFHDVTNEPDSYVALEVAKQALRGSSV